MEVQIAARLERIQESRGTPAASRPAVGSPAKADAMRVAGGVMRMREDAKRVKAQRQREEASG